jgi:hypothetical protein
VHILLHIAIAMMVTSFEIEQQKMTKMRIEKLKRKKLFLMHKKGMQELADQEEEDDANNGAASPTSSSAPTTPSQGKRALNQFVAKGGVMVRKLDGTSTPEAQTSNSAVDGEEVLTGRKLSNKRKSSSAGRNRTKEPRPRAVAKQLIMSIASKDLLFRAYLTCGILGMRLWAGKMDRCQLRADVNSQRFVQSIGLTNDFLITLGKTDCFSSAYSGSRAWTHPRKHFNHIFSALLSLYSISTTQNWQDLAFSVVDITGDDTAPSQNANWSPAIFFVCFFFVCFFLNGLFIGVVFDTYIRLTDESSGLGLLSDTQKRSSPSGASHAASLPSAHVLPPADPPRALRRLHRRVCLRQRCHHRHHVDRRAVVVEACAGGRDREGGALRRDRHRPVSQQ